MCEERNVPELRFEGFEGEWEETTLGEVSSSFEYGLNAAAKEYDGKNKYLRITDIDDETRRFSRKEITSPSIDSSKANNYKLSEGDILFARTGASVGKTYLYRKADGLVYYAGFLIRARVNPSHDSEFVFQNTLTTKYDDFVRVNSQRSGQPGVNASEYAKFGFGTPVYKEQKEIGDYLYNIDTLVHSKKRELLKLTQFKQAMLQKMFPKEGEREPEVRFEGFEGEWEVVSLKDVIQSEFKGKAQAEKLSHGQNEYLDADRLNGGKPLLVSESRNITKENILMLWDGSKAGTVYFGFEGVLGSTLKAFVIKDGHSPAFIYQYLQGNIQNIFTNYRTPNIPHVIRNFTDVFEVPAPTFEEQQKIGDYFRTIDRNIQSKQAELKKLKQFKQAMLDKLFV